MNECLRVSKGHGLWLLIATSAMRSGVRSGQKGEVEEGCPSLDMEQVRRQWENLLGDWKGNEKHIKMPALGTGLRWPARSLEMD